jgi:hypothetical protein
MTTNKTPDDNLTDELEALREDVEDDNALLDTLMERLTTQVRHAQRGDLDAAFRPGALKFAMLEAELVTHLLYEMSQR